MKYWFFGSSSLYAKYIITELENAGHTVIKFGRHNVDYTDPNKFLDSIDLNNLPDRIFFNANIQSAELDYTKNLSDQKETFDKFVESWKIGFWFKLSLLKYLENKMKGTFVFSTSTIMFDRLNFKECILYKILRSSEQQLIYSIGGKDKDFIVAGCCVSNMNDSNKKDYAKFVSNHLLTDGFNDNAIWTIADGKKVMHKMLLDWPTHIKFMNNGWNYLDE